MPDQQMVKITIEDLDNLRTLARYGLNQIVQNANMTVVRDSADAIDKLDHVIGAFRSEQLKMVEIEQSLTNIEDRGNSNVSR